MIGWYKNRPVRNRLFFFPLLVALFCFSCENVLYVAFIFPGKVKDLDESKSDVDIHLRLNPASLLEDELQIVNRSGDTVYISYKDVFYTVNGRNFTVPVEEYYDTYIMKINSKAALLCNESKSSYKCVDTITTRSNSFRGKGFTFGAIAPGQEQKGYISFNFPTPLNDSPLKEVLRQQLGKSATIFRGAITVKLLVGAKEE